MVQQLTLPSPRVNFIRTLGFSGNPSGMNSPEFLSRSQNFGPLQRYMTSLFIEEISESNPTRFGKLFCKLINLITLKFVTPIYKEMSPEDQGAYYRRVNIPLM